MGDARSETGEARPLRLWPAMVVVALMWAAAFGIGLVAPATMLQFMGMFLGPIVGLLLLVVWWMFFSRAPRRDRWIGVGALIVALTGTMLLTHSSATRLVIMIGIPFFSLGFIAWLLLSLRLDPRTRRLGALTVLVLGFFGWTLVRTNGVTGTFEADYDWRWSTTAEERFLASAAAKAEGGTAARDPDPAAVEYAAWPGFRGPGRDNRVEGLTIDTAWDSRPPREIWRRPIGPGWSSFSVAGKRLFTQEQRGEEEIVACYDADTGEPLWLHRNQARFSEALAGAGPRATPTYHAGRVYAVGATGIVDCLDATSGRVIWTRELTTDSGASVPDWGFSSSPLIVGDLAIVHAGGPDGKGAVAYDAGTGEPRWFAAVTGLSYSSPHLAVIEGVRQVLMLTGDGAVSVDPGDGSLLWEHPWPLEGAARIVQPLITDDERVMIGTGFNEGVRSIKVALEGGSWVVTPGWTSRNLKPYFNDFVAHRGHLFGFDGSILACVDATTGERAWKRGRYGNGQVLLIVDQDLLLVLSERGDVVLVAADPEQFREIARMGAIDGKTWNHPVIANDRLYVRNGEEAAAFSLPTATRGAGARTP